MQNNTIQLEKEAQTDIVNLIKKIAKENDIKNVKAVTIHVDPHESIVSFKIAQDWADVPMSPQEIDEAAMDVGEEKEEENDDSFILNKIDSYIDDFSEGFLNRDALADALFELVMQEKTISANP